MCFFVTQPLQSSRPNFVTPSNVLWGSLVHTASIFPKILPERNLCQRWCDRLWLGVLMTGKPLFVFWGCATVCHMKGWKSTKKFWNHGSLDSCLTHLISSWGIHPGMCAKKLLRWHLRYIWLAWVWSHGGNCLFNHTPCRKVVANTARMKCWKLRVQPLHGKHLKTLCCKPTGKLRPYTAYCYHMYTYIYIYTYKLHIYIYLSIYLYIYISILFTYIK